jgi:1-acyl-sn-glycerol-3-phosphate acyltransferase
MTTNRHPSLRWRARLTRRFMIALSHLLIRGWLRTDVIVTGQEHIPATGALLVTPNHRSLADAPFFWEFITRPHAFIGATEVFQTPVIGGLMRRLGHIEVVRGDRQSGAAAMQTAAEVLRQGGVVGICPEGGCSPNGWLMPFKDGAARLAIAAQCPIVPLAITGAEDILPMTIGGQDILTVPKRHWLRAGKTVTLRFGPPIMPQPGQTPKQLTALVRSAILDLLGDTEAGPDGLPLAA